MSNDDIYNSIIKKENGVNPFLAIMNYKISFKTWVKFAKKNIYNRKKKLGIPDDMNMSSAQDAQPHKIEVEIELEEFFSETTEDEEI